MYAVGARRRGLRDPAPGEVLLWKVQGQGAPGGQEHPSGRGLTVESLLVLEAGPSAGLPLPARPSAPGYSVPETG